MGGISLFFIALGLSMDAFAVCLSNGMCYCSYGNKEAFSASLAFGIFQAVMPLIGFALGNTFASYITRFSHWVAFILLGFIGGKMVWEAIHEDEETSEKEYKFNFKELIILSIATSIDALAVGIVFATENVNVPLAVILIGVITAVISFAGVLIGNKFGSKYEQKAEIAGGVVLVILGAKILLEGLGIIG